MSGTRQVQPVERYLLQIIMTSFISPLSKLLGVLFTPHPGSEPKKKAKSNEEIPVLVSICAYGYIRRWRTKKLLLGVAWVSDEQRRLVNCFPEAWGIDVAFGTNSEQRPLVSGTTNKLSTNQTMTHLHAFLPSLARWAYKWTFGTAMPLLLGKPALERINTVCTDGEENMYGPIVVLSQPGQVWGG
jgi:hypothetical protein